MAEHHQGRISYAASRGDLPGGDAFAAKLLEARLARSFEAHADPEPDSERPQVRGADMVAQDRPHPAPRPSPGLAREVDRATFDARWETARREARIARLRQERDALGRSNQANERLISHADESRAREAAGDIPGAHRALDRGERAQRSVRSEAQTHIDAFHRIARER